MPEKSAPRNQLDTIPADPEELARLVKLGAEDSHSDTQPNPLSAALLRAVSSRPPQPSAVPFELTKLPPDELRLRTPVEPDPPVEFEQPGREMPEISVHESAPPPASTASPVGWLLGVIALAAVILVTLIVAGVLSANEVVAFARRLLHLPSR